MPPQRTATSAIARRVLEACHQTDGAARITYVACDHAERTTIKLQAGAASTLAALQATLAAAFPLARVGTSENVLDGSMAAEIVVPSADDEWALARDAARRRKPVWGLWALGLTCAVLGLAAWADAEGGVDRARNWTAAIAATPADI